MSAEENQHTVANPFSTGGGGSVFEAKVQSGLLASLLVRAYVPGFEAAVIHELHLQAEHLSYATDDAVVIANDAFGGSRRQLWSVKHEVRFTEKDSVFQDVLRDAWTDYSNPDLFDPDKDMLVLGTAPLPATYKHLLTLLEIIRATPSYSHFAARLERQGFVSREARDYFDLLTRLSEQLTGRKPDAEEIWRFLRCFHILGFDFDQTASKDEARFKSLLALAIRAGTGGTGEDLWNAIFKWVAEKNPRAGTFTYDSLPEEWKLDATSIAVHFETGVIERLSEHSKLTLRRVRSEIGAGIRLPRADVVVELSTAFADEPLTLVSGEAGAGKSAAALMALQRVANGAPVFVFQAKEFAYRHLDQAWADMRIHESLSRISALFSLHRQKYILLESVERLLEASDRDAFSDLLAALSEDPTWRVVLTCRHYAANLVKDAFLTPAKFHARHIAIQKLSPDELNLVLREKPDLQSTVRDDRTRHLLRNPWFLDKASSINWTEEMARTPLDQSRLREILWQQIVMRVDAQQGGIHRKRERVFREIALGRARSMRSFVAAPDNEEATVQALLADELLVEDDATGFVAPAHDVLEDWALVRWVGQEFELQGDEPGRFFEKIGDHLSLRRAYRQWLQESLDGGRLPSIKDFANAVFMRSDLPSYWRDETIISILLSDDSPRFIEDYEARLMENDKEQLKIVIHLLRLVCKKPNPLWNLPEHVLAEQFGDMHLVPDGAAWEAIIQLTYRNLSQFDTSDLPYLLGVLEDWKSSVNWQTPSPPGAREAGLIVTHFWNRLEDDYHWKKEFNRLLEIILPITKEIPDEFEAIVRAAMEDDGDSRSYRAEIVGEKLLNFIEGGNACRSHPLLIADFARRKWMIDRDLPQEHFDDWGGGTDMESHFGLPLSSFEYFPASALQGPFYALLMSHPKTGIELIVDLVNVATSRFVERGLDAKYGDGPIKIEIDLGEGEMCEQWANPRLWLLYRGAMPGPDVVESALMSLEKYLLDLADQGHDLRNFTRNLIRRSNSVAITSIVASLAMAHPDKVGDTILGLLKDPIFYELDQRRYIHDQSYFDMGEWGFDARKKIHYRERLDSSKLTHRRENLEGLTVRLQTGSLREQVWGIIDASKEELESIEEQSEEIKLLRLKFHRMDIRNFEPKQQLEDGRVLFSSSPPEADIAEVIEKHAPAPKENEEETELVVWGMSVFERKDPEKFDPARWREMLERSRKIAAKKAGRDEFAIASYEGGPGYAAAVCVRDHWKELDFEERNWCRDFLLCKINEHKDTRNEFVRVQRFSMSSQVAAAKVLPLLLDDSDEATARKIKESIASALTHAVEEVRIYAAAAIGSYLWERDSKFAESCVIALIDWAKTEHGLRDQWFSIDWRERGKWEDFIAPEVSRVRDAICSSVGENQVVEFDSVVGINLRILLTAVSIISGQHQLALAKTIHLQLAKHFVNLWEEASLRDYSSRRDRDYEGESALKQHYASFIVRSESAVASWAWVPLAAAIDNHAKEVSEFFHDIIIAEDTANQGEGFWRVWGDTQQTILNVSDLDKRLSYEHGGLAKLASSLFFDGIPWKEDARSWLPAHGHERELREFAQRVGTAPSVCRSLIRLVSGIGAFLLPNAFLWIDDILRRGNPRELIGGKNELFNLACILTPFVFGKTSAIREDRAVREAVLRILDAMVDQGSPAAYRMRDFLISPVSGRSSPEIGA